ncbi:MAG: T9SS type A sorting domain-containing protein [Lentimicrobiaceae bacterium]|nr:T9SS type A sorting domain-containing protein [Lentimicrobiaceae bacterium]MCB9023740.1 T9SS type A sorting domain-containing protein [Lentimicrobiaceae bacterium]MCO5266998.1 T9SS type A sorting domain-containing protein [Lentimicrobium sp.]
MKNRNLLIGFLALMFGAGVFVLTTSATFRQVINAPATGFSVDGLADGWGLLSQMRNNQTTGQVNPADVLKARQQVAALKSSNAIGLNWISMGPDNFAGRTRALILDNQDASRKTIFTGSVSGGLWKSTTQGLTWNQINTDNVLINVSCMTQSPDGDIYVGTGESFASERFNLFSGFIGQGIYKSTDGNNFVKLASTNPGTFNNTQAEWAFVNKIAAGTGNHVFAATNGGLKYSGDGGQTWTMAKAGTEDLAAASSDVKMASDGTVAASVGNKLYISSNGDASNFVLRSTGAGADSLPVNGLSRIEVAFAPSDPSTIYAVLIADGSESAYLLGQLQGIYVSKDKGLTWRLVGPGASTVFNVFGNAANTVHRGNYAASVTVSETNPDEVYVGGVNVWEGKKILETGFYQWQLKSYGDAGSYIHAIVFDPTRPGTCYFASDFGVGATESNFSDFKNLNRNYRTAMFYTVAFDDKGRTLGGAQGGGVVFLDKEGNTPETGNQILGTFVGGSVEMSMVNPTSVFYSGTGGYMVRSQDLGVSEANAFVPDAIANANAGVFITPFRLWESFNNSNSRDSVTFVAKQNYSAGDVVMVKSKNAFSSSQKFPFNYTLTSNLANGDSIRVKDVISTRFFLGVTNAVYMTKEVLDFAIEPKFFKIATITGIPTAMAYSSDANYLFVGTSDGKLIRIANIALAYDSIRADVTSASCIISNSVVKDFGNRYVTSVAVDPNNDSQVIVTLGNYGNNEYIYRSTNALAETPDFNSIQGNLPAMPVYSVLIEMNNSNRVIIGTDNGVFTTESLGGSVNWTPENEGVGALPVMMIRQQTVSRPWIDGITGVNNYGAIYMATHGKGIYENRLFVGIDGPENPAVNKVNSLRVYPNPVSSVVNFNMDLAGLTPVTVKVYNLKGIEVKSVEFGTLSRGEHQLAVSAEGLSRGTYLLQVIAGNDVKTAKFVVVK